jgi:hypothetical protein
MHRELVIPFQNHRSKDTGQTATPSKTCVPLQQYETGRMDTRYDRIQNK